MRSDNIFTRDLLNSWPWRAFLTRNFGVGQEEKSIELLLILNRDHRAILPLHKTHYFIPHSKKIVRGVFRIHICLIYQWHFVLFSKYFRTDAATISISHGLFSPPPPLHHPKLWQSECTLLRIESEILKKMTERDELHNLDVILIKYRL